MIYVLFSNSWVSMFFSFNRHAWISLFWHAYISTFGKNVKGYILLNFVSGGTGIAAFAYLDWVLAVIKFIMYKEMLVVLS